MKNERELMDQIIREYEADARIIKQLDITEEEKNKWLKYIKEIADSRKKSLLKQLGEDSELYQREKEKEAAWEELVEHVFKVLEDK